MPNNKNNNNKNPKKESEKKNSGKFQENKNGKQNNNNKFKKNKKFEQNRGNGKPRKDQNGAEGVEKGFEEPGKQDPYWYAINDTQIKNLGSLPWNNINGVQLKFSDNPNYDGRTIPTPGGYRIGFVPTLQSDGPKSPMSSACTKLLEVIAKGFTTKVSGNAAGADILMLMIAAEQLYVLIAEGMRALGFLGYRNEKTLYQAPEIFEIIGFDYQSFYDDQANIRSKLNLLITRINSICKVPTTIAAADRWEWMVSNLFNDQANQSMAPFYAFVPEGYFEYAPHYLTTGTCLKFIKRPETYTAEGYIRELSELFATIENNSEAREILGAVGRVLGQDQMRSAPEIDASFTLEFQHFPLVQNIIHNAEWVGDSFGFVAPTDLLIEQPGGSDVPEYIANDVAVYQTEKEVIACFPCIDESKDVFTFVRDHNYVITDVCSDQVPDAGIVLDLTNNKLALNNDVTDTFIAKKGDTMVPYRAIVPRADVLTKIKVYYAEPLSTGGYRLWNEEIQMVRDSSTTSLDTIELLSKWNYHPYIYVYEYDTKNCKLIGETCTYTLVPRHQLGLTNRMSMYKLFLIPEATESVTGK